MESSPRWSGDFTSSAESVAASRARPSPHLPLAATEAVSRVREQKKRAGTRARPYDVFNFRLSTFDYRLPSAVILRSPALRDDEGPRQLPDTGYCGDSSLRSE